MIGRALLVAVLLSACAPAPSRDAVPTASPSATVPATTPATTTPSPALAKEGDVDGDGVADPVEIVESTQDRSLETWRWGVQASLSRLGQQTVWHEYGAESNEGQSFDGVADVDGDGDGEIVVSPGGTAYGRGYEILTLVGGRLTTVTGADLWVEHREEGRTAWGCAGGRVYVSEATTTDRGASFRGTVTYYRLVAARLVPDGPKTARRWRSGTAEPDEFADGVRCGSVGQG